MREGVPHGGPVRILDVDPDLGRGLSKTRGSEAVGKLVARAVHVEPGPWDAAGQLSGGRASAGLLVLEGLIAQDVMLGGATATELLGPGDFVRPQEVAVEHSFVNAQLRWTVVEPALVVLLDDTFARGLTTYPEVSAALLYRSAERTARLGLLRAAAHVGRVEDRLLALMWHLAARHGRVGPNGVILPLALRHRVLGDLVGASRSTVTLALGALERRAAIARRLEGGWVLLERLDDAPAPKVRRATTRSRHVTAVPVAAVDGASIDGDGRSSSDIAALHARVAGLSAVYQDQQRASTELHANARTIRDQSATLRRALHRDGS